MACLMLAMTTFDRIECNGEQDEEMNQLAVLAIDRKHVIKLLYPGFSRTVEPHAYGLDRNGNAMLLCYQTGGDFPEESQGWRFLNPGDAERVIETSEHFTGPRAGYSRIARYFRVMFAQL
jgi:hypothetical protein